MAGAAHGFPARLAAYNAGMRVLMVVMLGAGVAAADGATVSLGVDPLPKHMRVAVATSEADYAAAGTSSEHLRVDLRVLAELEGYEVVWPLGGLGVSYGHYAVGAADLDAFNGQAYFGARWRPLPWLSLDALAAAGLGYEVLTVPTFSGRRGDYLLGGIHGAALLRLALRPARGLELAVEGGYWGLYSAWSETPQRAEASVYGPTLGGAVGLSWDW